MSNPINPAGGHHGEAPVVNTSIPSATLEEKVAMEKPAEGQPLDEDEQDEDIDALIDELESVAGDDPEEEDVATGHSSRPIPEEVLNTDTRIGLTASVVEARRKKYGLNQMREEKENLILKFLMYFVGPIQFVMEVSLPFLPREMSRLHFTWMLTTCFFYRLLPFSLLVFRIGLISVLSVLSCCSTPVLVSSRNTRPVLLSRN